MRARTRVVLTVGALALALLASGCGTPRQAGLTWGDAGTSVEVAAGGTVTVSLEANPSTGYTWAVTSAGPLVSRGEPAFAAGGEAEAVGAQGMQTFTFDAPKSGTGTLTLVYARPWESVQPEKTWTAKVTVK